MSTPHAPKAPSARLLLVEDDVAIQRLVSVLLDYAQIPHDVASNGVIALDKLREGSYCVVLMDLEMPQMGGFEALEVLRADPALRHNTVVALSAHCQPGDQDKMLRAGFDACLAKPFDVNTLLALVRGYLPQQSPHP